MNMGWIYSSLNNGTGEGFQQPPRQLLGLPYAASWRAEPNLSAWGSEARRAALSVPA